MEFEEQVADAYRHLYDLVYLRTHPLAEFLVPDVALSRKDRAWRLHDLLREAVDELDPGPHAPAFSREWRRHRLMVLRYIDGLDAQAVADQLAIGRRHFYREEQAAIEAIVRVLWDRRAEGSASAGRKSHLLAEERGSAAVDLMRVEAARATKTGRYTSLDEALADLAPLLADLLEDRGLLFAYDLDGRTFRISVERSLLRQLLLALIGYFAERAEQATLRLSAEQGDTALLLALRIEPPSAVEQQAGEGDQERLAALDELARLCGVPLFPQLQGSDVIGFQVRLPIGPQTTVLVVDDNEDTIELIGRYLGPQGYRMVAARSVHQAMELAASIRPQVITVDLMMPEQDGWDLLHLLLETSDTADIPVVVCSVLSQAELALSLGATAFLQEPFSEQALIELIGDLVGR